MKASLRSVPLLADFDHPIEMLAACHERIEAQCETLQRLSLHLPQHGADEQARQAASAVMRYFDTAGRHHQDDEEQDLFPQLVAAARGENGYRVALLVARLKREHAEIEKAWLALRDRLKRIAIGEHAVVDELTVSLFASAYRDHIAIEEANLFPLAEMLLVPAQLAKLGRRMARRRGQKPSAQP